MNWAGAALQWVVGALHHLGASSQELGSAGARSAPALPVSTEFVSFWNPLTGNVGLSAGLSQPLEREHGEAHVSPALALPPTPLLQSSPSWFPGHA